MATSSNLPPDSYAWGQEVGRRIDALETSAKNLGTLTGGSNARLGPLLTQQATLLAQQATLLEQQEALIAQVAFLAGQSVYVDGGGGSTFDVSDCTDTVAGSPGYLPWVDDLPSTIVTPTSTGKLLAHLSWEGNIYSTTTTGFTDTSVFVDLEVGTVLYGGIYIHLLGIASKTGGGSIAFPSNSTRLLEGLTPGVPIRIRARIGAQTDSGVVVNPGRTGLTITKLGM